MLDLQGGDKRNGNDGLACSELRSTSDNTVVNALSSSLLSDNLDSRRATTLLFVDLFEGRLLRAVHAEKLHGGECNQLASKKQVIQKTAE